MPKKENPKNPLKKDSTTDFFLNFITRQKSEQKKVLSMTQRQRLLTVK